MKTYYIDFVVMTMDDQKSMECNTVIVQNNGTANALIGGILLLSPGQGFTIDGYPGEMCNQNFEVTFPAGPASGNRVTFIQKKYKQ